MNTRKARTTLAWHSFALASTVTALIAVILVTSDKSAGIAEILSDIGVNLIAAVAFAIVFSSLASWTQQKALEDSVNDQISNLSSTLRSEIGEVNNKWMPIAMYPPLDPTLGDFGDSFNMDITRKLERSATYMFRGPSAHYVAARLKKLNRSPQSIRIAMLSPSDEKGIARHAPDRVRWSRSQGKDMAALRNEIRSELIQTTVSLFDHRAICPVELAYIEDTGVYRYEMTDDSVFISWYHGPGSTTKEMPQSLRFSSESFLYQTLRLDLIRRFEMSKPARHVQFEASHDDDFLISHLSSVLASTVTAQDLKNWREDYGSHTAQFAGYLDQLYRKIDT